MKGNDVNPRFARIAAARPPRAVRSTAALTLALAVGAAAVLGARPLGAADGISIPIATSARKAEALPAGAEIELSLSSALALALKNTLDLDVASKTYEQAGFGFDGAKGVYDPFVQLDLKASRTQSPVFSRFQAADTKRQSLDGTFGGLLDWGTQYSVTFTNSRSDQVVQGFTLVNPTLSSNLTASVTQPLLRGFGRDVNDRLIVQARIARDQSAWEFVKSVQTAVQAVENAYWDLVYAQENLKSKLEALDRAKDFNRITKIKIDVGALAPIEIVQTEVSIAQREQDIITAEGQIGDAQDRLKRLLNVTHQSDWNRPIAPTDRPGDEPIRADVEAGIKRALELRPEMKQAIVDIESKKIGLLFNRNQLLPKLDLTASYGFGGVGAPGAITDSDGSVRDLQYVDAYEQIGKRDFPSWSVAVSLNVPIFNRTAKANAASAATELELTRTSFALLKQNLTVEVRAAGRALDTAYRTILAARKSRELAERNLDAEKKKYDNGMTTSFTVAQVQNDLTAARSQELNAIAGYRKAITSWHRAVGDLLAEKGIEIQGLPVTLDPTPAEEGALR